MRFSKYTPIRLTECFFDADGEIEIRSSTGTFRLKSIGRTIWYMLDGKHTIGQIAEQLCRELDSPGTKYEEIYNELIVVLKMLQQRDSILANWDPLYKLTLSQEL